MIIYVYDTDIIVDWACHILFEKIILCVNLCPKVIDFLKQGILISPTDVRGFIVGYERYYA